MMMQNFTSSSNFISLIFNQMLLIHHLNERHTRVRTPSIPTKRKEKIGSHGMNFTSQILAAYYTEENLRSKTFHFLLAPPTQRSFWVKWRGLLKVEVPTQVEPRRKKKVEAPTFSVQMCSGLMKCRLLYLLPGNKSFWWDEGILKNGDFFLLQKHDW